jgi:quercetin dioxygenase-like cupin family protein
MQVRRFSADMRSPIPGKHVGLWGVPILFDARLMPAEPAARAARAQRFNGMPLLLDAPVLVVAHYYERHAHMDEHRADEPILMLALSGAGKLRLGGLDGETRDVRAGDAVIWPAHVDHTVWTEGEELELLLVHVPPERQDPNTAHNVE